MKIRDNFKALCEARDLPVYVGLKHHGEEEKSLHIKMSGCNGFCEMGPRVHIEPMGILYIHVKPEDCEEILEKTVLGGESIDRLVYKLDGVAYPRQEDSPFYKRQNRVVLENCGTSDAEDIEEYIAKGGYAGFEKALFEMTDEEICKTIIDGSEFSFRLHVNTGAGAFVCGGGSALTASIEGNRGMPHVKPPRTIEKGLWEKPTVLNNVETFANVPQIILKGVDWYHAIGTERSPGTKVFALTGNVMNTGLIEVPMGITIKEVVLDIGGGKKFKAVQIGDPSGGATTVSAEHLNLPLDFGSLKKIGAMIGSGGLVVMDEDTCMVETACFFMEFTQKESCGKCAPCREGAKRMLEILNRIGNNEGTLEDPDLLEELAGTITSTALCGLVNAKKLLADIDEGKVYYDLVEVMTCKTGCVGGAGQSRGLKQQHTEGLYDADRNSLIKHSESNPMAVDLLKKLGEKKHELLHVHYRHSEE